MHRRREAKQKEYGIGDMAAEFGMTHRALRFYEDKGLVLPRREGSARYYSEDDRRRLKFITLGRRMDLALSEIKELLEHFDLYGEHPIPIQTTIEKLKQHLQALQDERAQLDWAITKLSRCIPVLQRKIA